MNSLLVPGLRAEGSIQGEGGRGEEYMPANRGKRDRKRGRFSLTSIDKSPRGTFAELLGLIGQRDFHNTRNMPRWSLDADGVGSYQLH